jgi:hypothetical protein
MKLKDLLQMVAPLQALSTSKLPVKVGYRVSKILRKIEPELKAYETSRMDLFKEFGVHDVAKDQYSIPPEKMAEFGLQMQSLVDEDLGLDLPTIRVSELGDLTIEPTQLLGLDPILVDDTEEVTK